MTGDNNLLRCREVKFLTSTTPGERIVSMLVFNERVFLATETGVFVKDENDVFKQLEIQYLEPSDAKKN